MRSWWRLATRRRPPRPRDEDRAGRGRAPNVARRPWSPSGDADPDARASSGRPSHRRRNRAGRTRQRERQHDRDGLAHPPSNLESGSPVTVVQTSNSQSTSSPTATAQARAGIRSLAARCDRALGAEPALSRRARRGDAENRDRVSQRSRRSTAPCPHFWLDVADWAWRKSRREEAVRPSPLRVELPTRNSQTLSIVARTAVRYGELDRAIANYEAPRRRRGRPPAAAPAASLCARQTRETAPRERARATSPRRSPCSPKS